MSWVVVCRFRVFGFLISWFKFQSFLDSWFIGFLFSWFRSSNVSKIQRFKDIFILRKIWFPYYQIFILCVLKDVDPISKVSTMLETGLHDFSVPAVSNISKSIFFFNDLGLFLHCLRYPGVSKDIIDTSRNPEVMNMRGFRSLP